MRKNVKFAAGLCVLAFLMLFTWRVMAAEDRKTSAGSMNEPEFVGICAQVMPRGIEAALKDGANANARNSEGYTALMAAAMKNPDSEAVKVLLNAGADIDAKGPGDTTALMEAAAENSNPEVIEVLLNAGADIDARLLTGATALMVAAMNNSNPEVIKVLLNAGADANAEMIVYGERCKALDLIDIADNQALKNTEAERMLRAATTDP